MYCYYKFYVALPHGAVSWSAVYVIVVFPDHTHFLLHVCALDKGSEKNIHEVFSKLNGQDKPQKSCMPPTKGQHKKTGRHATV